MAAGQTVIIYGDLIFFNVLTRHVNCEAMFDDTGTDEIGRKFTVSAIGHVHGLPTALVGALPTTGDSDAASALVRIRYLMSQRQHFEYRLGVTVDSHGNIDSPGTALIVCDPANNIGGTNVNGCDINNGPKAECLDIQKITANSVITCELRFEVCMLQCDAAGGTINNSGILNNRWSVVDDIDCNNWLTTRTWTGKLRLSSSQVNPHSFRHLVVPPMTQGMRRAHMQFTAAEDGLSLLYTVTDEEIAFAPPAPATTWHATFGQRVTYDQSLGHVYDCNIALGGDRNCDLKKLISIASSMALAKFSNGVKLANDNRYRVLEIEVTEMYSDRAAGIQFRASAQRVDFEGPDKLGLNTKFLGVPITGNKIADVVANYDSRLSRGMRTGETIEINGPISLVGAAASVMQSGCGINFGITTGMPAQIKGQPVNGTGVTVTALVTKDIPADGSITTVFGTANGDGMYTHSVVQVDEDTDAGRVIAPIASGTSSPSSSGGSSSYNTWLASQEPSSAVIDLAPPTKINSATIDMERIGKPPAEPTIRDSSDGKTKILRKKSETLSPSATADGKKVFRKRIRVWWWEQVPLGIDPVTGNGGPNQNPNNKPQYYFPFVWVDVDDIKPPPANQTTPGYHPGF